MTATKPDKSALKRARYWLLSHLPGARGNLYLRKFSRAQPSRVAAAFEAALAEARGGVCVDLGANRGVLTRRLAAVAAEVHAFEPDPWSAGELRRAVADLPNVTVIEAAAGTEDGEMPIYRAPGFEADPATASLSTTLIADKINVDPSAPLTARVVDFCAWLVALDRDVALVKMDIEGAEVALLEKLLDHPVAGRIGHIFVETHETRVPALAARSRALRARVRRMTRPRVNMDWN